MADVIDRARAAWKDARKHTRGADLSDLSDIQNALNSLEIGQDDLKCQDIIVSLYRKNKNSFKIYLTQSRQFHLALLVKDTKLIAEFLGLQNRVYIAWDAREDKYAVRRFRARGRAARADQNGAQAANPE